MYVDGFCVLMWHCFEACRKFLCSKYSCVCGWFVTKTEMACNSLLPMGPWGVYTVCFKLCIYVCFIPCLGGKHVAESNDTNEGQTVSLETYKA